MRNKESIPVKNLDIMAHAIRKHAKRLFQKDLSLEESRKLAKKKLLAEKKITPREFVKLQFA